MQFDHLYRRFIDMIKVAFSVGEEAIKDQKMTFENLNHVFFDFIGIAFFVDQEAENEIAVPSKH